MEPRSIRLNGHNRDQFIRKVMNDLMPFEEQPSIDKFEEKYRKTIYKRIYGPYKETIDALPDWMKKKVESIEVQLGRVCVSFMLAKEEYVAEGVCVLDEHDELTLAYKAVIQQRDDWNTKRSQLLSELRKVVHACNTSAQLYLAWPKSLDYAD